MKDYNFYSKIMFIGCFNLDFSSNAANSSAANQVQIEIIDNICKTFAQSDVITSVNKPQRTWPYSQFVQRSQVIGKYKFHGFLNILFLKDIIIYIRHLLLILSFKPIIVFKYNITLFESLFLFFLKNLFRIKVVVFIQDVSHQDRNSSLIKKHLEIFAIKISSSFDVVVPITKDFLNDFTLNKEKCVVFQGGLTSQSKILISSKIDFEVVSNSKYLVFAGALEEYNGIKDIVDYWVNNNVDFNLHIYGKGTFENYIKECANKVENIKYFGFASESVIIFDQLSAFGNFCLRNSKGINEKYFFPSKFFNVLACPGKAFVNDFHNIPEMVKQNCYVLEDDLTNFNQIIDCRNKEEDIRNYNARLDWLKNHADWSNAIVQVKNLLDKA
jgi:hypothetical protein